MTDLTRYMRTEARLGCLAFRGEEVAGLRALVGNRALVLHQVHPARLATDGSAEVVSCVLLCQHKPAAGSASGWFVRPSRPRRYSAVILSHWCGPPVGGMSWRTCCHPAQGIWGGGRSADRVG